MKYYLVTCKFGHVGRDKYLPLDIPVIADSIKEASFYAKNKGGVKKDHKDWCLRGPIEVSKEMFDNALLSFNNDVYFEKHSRQRLYLFEDRLVDEKNYTRINNSKTNTKIYKKKRSKSVVEFKRKKQLEIIKILMKEQVYVLQHFKNLNVSIWREIDEYISCN